MILTQIEKNELALDTYRLRQFACGTLALLIFDVLINLKEEIVYVWRGSWSLFKTLYLICRYASFVIPCLIIAPANTSNFCTGYKWYIFSGTMLLGIYPSECLFAVRLDRLYTTKTFRWTLIFLAIAEAIAYIFLVILNVMGLKLNAIPLSATLKSSCIPNKAPLSSLILGLGVPSFVIAALYCCFAMAAFYKHLKQRKNFNNYRFLRESGTLAPILIILFRDGVVCYIFSIAGYLAGLILYAAYSNSILINVAPLVVIITSSTISSRLVLILKGDPSYATGVYRAGNDFLVNRDDRPFQESIDSTSAERDGAPDFMTKMHDEALPIQLDVL